MTTLTIPPETPLHKRIITKIQERMKMSETERAKNYSRWRDAEERVLAYLPTSTIDAKRKQRRSRGEPQYTTLQIPYTFAQLMAAHTYWTSVFFGRNPIHQVAGRHGEGEMQVQAIEALLAYQVEVGKMLAPYYLWLYDAGKYGEGILGTYWDKQQVQFSEIVEEPDPDFPDDPSKTVKRQITRKIEGYCGHRAFNVSPFDFFPDPRVTMREFQKGEFAGVRQRVMWSDVVIRAASGYYTNLEKIISDPRTSIPDREDGSSQLLRPRSDWTVTDDEGKKHPALLEIEEVYVMLIPREWGVGDSSYPEKWVFSVTNERELVIGAQPLGSMHGDYPFDIFQPEVEAYGASTRGIPEIMEPVQNTMDWLLNSHMYNIRAVLNNQLVVDPTRIVMKDVEKGGPGFVFRMKPEAYGQDVRSMIYQVPVHDVTGTHMNDLQTMFGIGERIFGINDQILGVLTGAGRKTATEVRTSTGFGTNRLKTTTEYLSASGFSSHAQKLIIGSQQWYDAPKKLRIVGDLAMEAGQGFFDVTPEMILGSFDFVPVDGTLPIDRFAQVTLWKELLAQIATSPQIMAKYDLGKIFTWVAQLAGIKNVKRFQIVPDGQLQQQAQAGNIVPLPGNRAPGMAGMPQLSNMGPPEGMLQ